MAVRKSNTLLLLLVVMVLVVLVPTVRANIDTYDDYWKSRAKEAKLDALEAFDPSPGDVTHEFNQKVEKMIFGKNDTRRNLRGKKGRKRKNDGPCMATNPIDQCWRCRSNWAAHRKRLADCVIGFGRKTTGGKHGGYYFVTDPSDDDLVNPKPGTLRHAVIQPGPLWITFKNSMVIRLQEELIMTSNKTIDGRGVNVHIADGAGFTIQYIKNVIIHGIRIHDIVSKGGGTIRDSIDHFGTRTRSDGDGISIYGSSHIWIDHVAMWNCSDGLIDAIEGSTAITISNNHFSRHNDAMLFGASDTNTADAVLQVTLAFNHFGKKLIQRMPRCRWGFFHIVNNDYTHWEMYAVGGSANPTIISQGNRYRASPYQDPEHDTRQVTKRDYASEAEWSTWTWRSDGDVMLNDAYFIESGTPLWKNDFSRYEMIEAKPGTFVSELTRFTGALTCRSRSPC